MQVEFNIEDTGIGIRKEDLASLYSSFDALEVVNNSNIKGTGLGLDISKYFSELMGGKIECESDYGIGTTFTVTLQQRL